MGGMTLPHALWVDSILNQPRSFYGANDNLPSPLKCDCLTDHVAFLSFPNLSFISFPLFMSGCCWLALLSFCFQIYHFLCLDARSFFLSLISILQGMP